MVHPPRWLSLVTAGLVAAFVLSACTPAAAPTATPTVAPTAGTTDAPTDAPTSGPTDAPTEAPTDEPSSTAYPDPAAQPGDPAGITDAYPNYGEVDCEGGTFNGLPYTGTLKSITAPDASTVVFTLCAPDVAFLSKIAFSVFGINDSDYLIAHAATGDQSDFMNGTGPYKLDEWRRGAELDFSRFDGYWGEPAAAATAVLRWGDSPASRLQELQAGTIDGMTLVGPADFDTVRNDASLQLKEGSGLNTLYLGMNHDYAPWDNPVVREALAIGIDRQRVVDLFMPPGSEVASHFTPCQIPFGCVGDEWPAFDKDAARAMILAEFPEGIETTLAWRNPPARGYMPLPDETATDIQAQLAEIGITVTLDHQESGTYIGNANSGNLKGLFLLGWGADYPDVTNFLDYHFGTGCTAAFGVCYPEIFDNLVVGGTSADEAIRTQAYTDANNAILEQVPMVPISHAGFANAYLAGVEGAQVSPLSNELLFRMVPPDGRDQIVFMQNAEPIGLYCADETDGESLRACEQSVESLYSFEVDGTATEPALATSCTPNDDLSVWTCTLREGVLFHNGATFEAKDVIASFAAQWDVLSALHVGNTGIFEYWGGLWGGNLNPPAPCGIPGQPACAE